MSNSFSELIKNFDKTRDYMRDFYIYGFKTRNDFHYKSLRTYDDEKRRIESWLGEFIKYSSSKKGKQIFISCDCGQLNENPLYNAYRCKSFTKNDIQLHFFLLDIIPEDDFMSLNEITDKIINKFNIYFEPQTIRMKLNEYINEGIIVSKKSGRSLLYAKSGDTLKKFLGDNTEEIVDMIKFFSESAPFGIIGNYILKSLHKVNDIFMIKHNFIVHTLEDNILLSLCSAIDEKRFIELENYGKSHKKTLITGIPVKILVSTQTGRRYVIIYCSSCRRFMSLRLDYIKKVKILDISPKYDYYKEKYEKNSVNCWGTSFGQKRSREGIEYVKMTLFINEEKERFILERLRREGRTGTIVKINKNVFQYYGEFFDVSELSPWIKTFIGRIIDFETNNTALKQRFYGDIRNMHRIYKISENSEKSQKGDER